jgi:anaerobic selenocysteine-containing dehydrogenase
MYNDRLVKQRHSSPGLNNELIWESAVGIDEIVDNHSIETKITYCRVCMVTCGLAVDVDVANDRIVKVKGDFTHPLTKGYTCPKGRATGQVRHLPNAITRPMIRKDGDLVPVSWDEALDDVAAKLRKTIDIYGPDSIGMYFGSGLGIDSSAYVMEEAFYNQARCRTGGHALHVGHGGLTRQVFDWGAKLGSLIFLTSILTGPG